MPLVEPINSHVGSESYGNNPELRVWKPITVGEHTLQHRIFLTPLTRMRANGPVQTDDAVVYYEQRTTEGALLVTEATFISKASSGYPNVPGIYSLEQVEAWKKVTEAVHAKGGIIYCQLWNIGINNYGGMSDVPIIGPGTVNRKFEEKVNPMRTEDILQHIEDYKHAARMAMDAGFDGCEVHGAHGYLLEQFLHPKLNNCRTDEYSAESLENRSRFLLQAVEAVAKEIGPKKTAIRLSPFASLELDDIDVFETYGYICKEIKSRIPELAYLSLTDPRWTMEPFWSNERSKKFSNDYFRAIMRGISPETVSKDGSSSSTIFPDPTPEHPTVILSAGGYAASDAEAICERTGDVVGFGRIFISNPDLVHRLRNGLELNAYDRSTFYSSGKEGYTDYPFANEETKRFVPLKDMPSIEAAEKLSDFLVAEKENSKKLGNDLKEAHGKIAILEKEKQELVSLKNNLEMAKAQVELNSVSYEAAVDVLKKKATDLEAKNLEYKQKIVELEQVVESFGSSSSTEPAAKTPMSTTVDNHINPSEPNKLTTNNEGFSFFCLNIQYKK